MNRKEKKILKYIDKNMGVSPDFKRLNIQTKKRFNIRKFAIIAPAVATFVAASIVIPVVAFQAKYSAPYKDAFTGNSMPEEIAVPTDKASYPATATTENPYQNESAAEEVIDNSDPGASVIDNYYTMTIQYDENTHKITMYVNGSDDLSWTSKIVPGASYRKDNGEIYYRVEHYRYISDNDNEYVYDDDNNLITDFDYDNYIIHNDYTYEQYRHIYESMDLYKVYGADGQFITLNYNPD